LGCLTSVFICYLGVHCGRLFVCFRKTSSVKLFLHLSLEVCCLFVCLSFFSSLLSFFLLQGAFLATLGAGLAGFSQYVVLSSDLVLFEIECFVSFCCSSCRYGGVIPIVKNLWSLSFVLVMAGTGYILCFIFFFVVDLRMWWTGAPFRQLGINSIFIYVCHEVLSRYVKCDLLFLQNIILFFCSETKDVSVAMVKTQSKLYFVFICCLCLGS
jgi:hypothetical protein